MKLHNSLQTIHKSIGCNKYNEYFLHTFNENVIAMDIKQIILATDLHGLTRLFH